MKPGEVAGLTPDGFAKARRRGLNRLRLLRNLMIAARRLILVRLFGMDIHPSAEFSLSARFDRTFPVGIHIGAKSYVAFDAAILTHDRTRGLYLHTWVGERCFIGGRSIILPGVSVGDGSIVGAGSVVTRDVPAGSVVAGNPARIISEDIDALDYGRLRSADATEHGLAISGQT